MTKLNAQQLRASKPRRSQLGKIKHRKLYIICDSILDAFNIGSIFRLADAMGVKKIYLCGDTQVPPYHRIAKAAVGTDKWVEWEKMNSAEEAIKKVRKIEPKITVFVIEQGKGSSDFRKITFTEPLAFVIGHESAGVSRGAINVSDTMIEIPMFGVNKSLNVLISLAIVMSKVIDKFD